jgi:dimeric dUTPase (all-alpha-NTP-PPase superfamily)
MKKAIFVFFASGFLWFGLETLAQFKPEEVADFAKWEDFLQSAKIVDQRQMSKSEGVTRPWVLTLEKDGVTQRAFWKNPTGSPGGYQESWKTEIAAYRLSKTLGLDMVPPTVEKEREGDKGSCQLGAKYWKNFEEIINEKLQAKGIQYVHFIRKLSLQRAWDNLVNNIDRHRRNYLITEDWRMILIDHSRAFMTDKKYNEKLFYDEKNKENKNFIMDQLPRAFVEKLKSLDAASIKSAVGEYLTEKEIDATLKRRDMMIAWIDNHIKEKGEDYVLY